MRVHLLASIVICSALAGAAAAHPPPPPPPELILPAPLPAPKPHSVWEAQLGGGLGRYAASNERWLAFSLGWHQVKHRGDVTIGDELGVDVELRLGEARDGSSLIVGARPIARRLRGDVRTPSLVGLALPELSWSTGDGRERALRVEWTAPLALSIGRDGVEWDVVRAGAVFAADGVHASFGTELRFVLR